MKKSTAILTVRIIGLTGLAMLVTAATCYKNSSDSCVENGELVRSKTLGNGACSVTHTTEACYYLDKVDDESGYQDTFPPSTLTCDVATEYTILWCADDSYLNGPFPDSNYQRDCNEEIVDTDSQGCLN